MSEHECEPVRGLPDYLPDGEFIVWQGEPVWRQLALRVFHLRKVAIYFALLAGLHVGLQVHEGAGWVVAAKGASWLVLLGAGALVVLGVLARLYAKTTVYTITNRRLVLRYGVALPMMINIPWEKVDAADLKVQGGNTGSIALSLAPDRKMAFWLLWPNARPWHFSPAQPMLRCIADPQGVAEKLQQVVGQQPSAVVTPIRPEAPDTDHVDDTAGTRTAAFS
jgi:hypothetical protein